jgi:hypothetical protein
VVGIYAEYLDKNMAFPALIAERKAQLSRISQARGGRDIVVYAADLRKGNTANISISYEDLLPFSDQLSNLRGDAVDVIIETPGGFAEIAEDLVRLLRDRYRDVAFIVPGTAKSAGTIMVMSGDEILMEPGSSLGPIDAQLQWQGKVFSAEAFLKGLERIKEEVDKAGSLNRAYIPILQNISPGEIQHAENALSFAKQLVTRWLADYKFKNWHQRETRRTPVTAAHREARAREIAEELCNHSRWLSHGRSIKIADLVAMQLRITDYSKSPALYDPIRRYHTLLQMTFETNVYKVFETPSSQIYRFLVPQTPGVQQPIAIGDKAIAELECGKCRNKFKLQLNFAPGLALEAGCIAYPTNDIFRCPNCGLEHNLADMRRQVEMQTKKQVIR